MAKSLFEMVTATAIAAYYEELASNRIPYLGEALFPADKKMGLKLEWIKGQGHLPVALQPSAFDAKPLVRDRSGVSIESTKMPFFRESMRLGEEDRQQLLMFLEANNNAYANTIINRIFNDTKELIDSAMAQIFQSDGAQTLLHHFPIRCGGAAEYSAAHVLVSTQHDGIVYGVGEIDIGNLTHHGDLRGDVFALHLPEGTAVHLNVAGIVNQSRNRPDQRCFAAAVGAEEAIIRLILKAEGDFVQYRAAIVAGADLVQIQHLSVILLLRK
jgi:hypothetical protein